MSCKYFLQLIFFVLIAHLQSITIHYENVIPEVIIDDSLEILFLHEALGSIGQWKDFPQVLCNQLGLNGIVYERQGHGQSSPLTEKRTASYLRDYALEELPAFLESLNSDKKLLLVGHSDGGTIALLYASRFPEIVAGVVTMAAHVINEKETVSGIQPAIDAYKAGKLEGLKKYHGDKTETLFYAWADIWCSQDFLDWNITFEISNPNTKGLFIQGKDDQYGTSKQIELIEKNYTGTSLSLLLENCGHHPHLEQKSTVIEAVETWWKAPS